MKILGVYRLKRFFFNKQPKGFSEMKLDVKSILVGAFTAALGVVVFVPLLQNIRARVGV